MTKESKQPESNYTAIWMGDFSEIIKEAIDNKTQSQVNGFDLSVKEIFTLEGDGVIDFDNSKRTLPNNVPVELENDAYWSLSPGSYILRYNEIVTVPMNAVGIIQPRSTLMRMGATIIGAWWDSGYSGRGQGLLIVGRPVKIYRNARVAQIVFILSKKVDSGYKGAYQNEAK
ncbi:MAG: deoxyuridine 5'-triphosphate nucleotidohydrolase [Candidatus Heimdallarchaeota archaeon]|nr:deoxyuridine 5'-triphosphate nucleotidohydrolase [Candidatus Heimdallarchaeota archaeon]